MNKIIPVKAIKITSTQAAQDDIEADLKKTPTRKQTAALNKLIFLANSGESPKERA